MSRLWTEPAPQIDAALNQRLARLAEALEPVAGKPVVFHDAAGGFAPVIDDDSRLHIHIYAAARPISAQRRTPRTANPFPAEILTGFGQPLPRLAASSSRELSAIACELRGARNTRLLQRVRSTVFLLIHPAARQDEGLAPIDAEILFDLLAHAFLVDTFRVPGAYYQPECVRHRPGSASGIRALEEAARRDGRFRLMAGLASFSSLLAAARSALQGRAPHPRSRLQARLEGMRARAQTIAAELVAPERALDHRRQEQMARAHLRDSDREAALRRQLDQIAELPQVRRVEIQREPTGARLKISLAPMTLGADQTRGGGTCVLAPIEITLPATATDPLLTVHDVYGSRVPAAHVRDRACLGSLAEMLRDTLNQGDLVTATTLAIGFLQTFNADDPWGAIAASWPRIQEIEVGAGNTVRLPLPARADAEPPAPDLATPDRETPARPEADAPDASSPAASNPAADAA